MTSWKRVARALILAIWFGGGLALAAIAAPAAFKGSPDSAAAASIVTILLSQWHWIAISSPLVLLLTGDRRSRRVWQGMLLVLIMAGALAVSQAGLDHSVHKLRADSRIPISSLAKTDPVRKKFGMLHGASSMLMAFQILLAGIAIGLETRELSPPMER